jgi:hypothetical protein
MVFPLALAICENDLERDLTFLKAFAGPRVDLRVTPVHGVTLKPGHARLLERQMDAAISAGLTPRAVLVHSDGDRRGYTGHRQEIQSWFDHTGLRERGCKLIASLPNPCIERWLCVASGLTRAKDARPSAGCDPWKAAWSRGKLPDLERVRRAALVARKALRQDESFAAFYTEWVAAGLEHASPI